MSPFKKLAMKGGSSKGKEHSASKKSSKRPRTNSDKFISADANMAIIDWYKRATIIMERVVQLDTFENTYIPEVFKERTLKTLAFLKCSRGGHGRSC